MRTTNPSRTRSSCAAYLNLNPDPLYRPYAYYHLAECRRRLGDKAGGRAFGVQAASTRYGTLYEQLARERLARDLLEAEGATF